MKHQPLGEILLINGVISERELDFALAYQAASGGTARLGAILVEQGFADGQRVAKALAKQAGWEYWDEPYEPDNTIIQEIGLALVREQLVLPLRSQGALVFLMPDGNNIKATDLLLTRFGHGVIFRIGPEADIMAVIDRLSSTADLTKDPATDINQLLAEAVRQGATDIHIEPSLASVNVRLRVDGVLHFFRAFPRGELARVINVFFNRAGISAGDFLHFHDARFTEEYAGHKLDVRLSHIPSVNGSSLVLRLLDKSRSAVSLSELGYAPENQNLLSQALKRPHGLILFTGPTGCGKTTSLYSLLSGLKGLSLKVVTAEDPVEVRLPLVTQVAVDNRKDQDFHHITRALLRHDPDIILIGEVRDEKTAREAVRAAVTGHRVLATLHTNDVLSAILRLNDLGIDYPQLSHTLTCIVSQRLVRLLCPHCKVAGDDGQDFKARGCGLCLGGFKNRTVVAEVMLLDDEMRFLIEKGLIQELSGKYAASPGRITMLDDGRRLIREGKVSYDEIERVLG